MLFGVQLRLFPTHRAKCKEREIWRSFHSLLDKKVLLKDGLWGLNTRVLQVKLGLSFLVALRIINQAVLDFPTVEEWELPEPYSLTAKVLLTLSNNP